MSKKKKAVNLLLNHSGKKQEFHALNSPESFVGLEIVHQKRFQNGGFILFSKDNTHQKGEMDITLKRFELKQNNIAHTQRWKFGTTVANANTDRTLHLFHN